MRLMRLFFQLSAKWNEFECGFLCYVSYEFFMVFFFRLGKNLVLPGKKQKLIYLSSKIRRKKFNTNNESNQNPNNFEHHNIFFIRLMDNNICEDTKRLTIS